MASLDEEFDAAKDLDAEFDAAPDVEPTPSVKPNSRGSFFEFLKAKLSGEADPAAVDVGQIPGVRTIDTPTGVTHLDANGRPVYSPEEARQMSDAGTAKFNERALEGGLSFLSGGAPMLDEAKGVVEAYRPSKVADDLMGSGDDPFKRYVRERDRTRSMVGKATANASPTATVMGHQVPLLPVAGAVASSLGAGLPETLAGRLGLGAALGAGTGFWNSDADNAADMAKDTAVGGGVGLVSAGVAEVPGAIARGGTNLMQRGATKQAAKDITSAATEAQSALGVAGSAGSSVQRGIEYVDSVMANPSAFDPQQVALAQRLAADPAIAEARKRVAENAMKQLRHNINYQQQTAKEAADLMSTIPQRAQAATDEALSSPYVSALLPRAERFGTRAALGAAGQAVGGATGGVVSATPGAVQMFMNATRDPRLQYAIGRDVARIAGPIGNSARASLAGAEAATANRNAYQALLERFGISAKSKQQLADEAFLLGQSEPDLQSGR